LESYSLCVDYSLHGHGRKPDDALRLWKVLLDRHKRHRHDACFRGCFGHLAILGYRLESNSLVDVRSAGEAERGSGVGPKLFGFHPGIAFTFPGFLSAK